MINEDRYDLPCVILYNILYENFLKVSAISYRIYINYNLLKIISN